MSENRLDRTPPTISRSSHDRGEPNGSSTASQDPVQELRELLVAHDQQELDSLQSDVEQVERLLDDDEFLAARISALTPAILRQSLEESPDAVADALYPVIHKLVARMVVRMMRDLARQVDRRMRSVLHPATVARRIRARLGGVSEGELMIRDALSFQVTDVLLVHRETGLLLSYVARGTADQAAADVTSAMLTALRHFAVDTFGLGEGELQEIQHGDDRILIATGRYSFIAALVEGVESADLWEQLRLSLKGIEKRYAAELAHYDGDPSPFAAATADLRPLLQAGNEKKEEAKQFL